MGHTLFQHHALTVFYCIFLAVLLGWQSRALAANIYDINLQSDQLANVSGQFIAFCADETNSGTK